MSDLARPMHRLLSVFLLLLPVSLVRAEDLPRVHTHAFTAKSYTSNRVRIPGNGRASGFSIFQDVRSVRYMAGDSASWSSGSFDDRAWAKRQHSDSLVKLDAPVYWIRFHFSVDSALAREHLMLHVTSPGALEVWMDGIPLMRSSAGMDDLPKEITSLQAPAALLDFTLGKVAPDTAHVLAFRLVRPAKGGSFKDLKAVVHSVTATGSLHRSAMHHGVFIGVNVLMLLMALIYWRLSRQDKVWPWFAALTAINAFMAFNSLLGNVAIGLPSSVPDAVSYLSTLTILLPLVLSVIVLQVLLGKLDRRRLAAYVAAAVLISATLAALTRIGDGFGNELDLAAVITVVVLVILLAIGYLWLAVDALRFGWQALETKGYVRWLGAGIVLSVLAPVLKYLPFVVRAMVLQQQDEALPTGLVLATDYMNYIAIPLSIIIALAIRAAEQHRLLSRQRDELDEEVRERTAELRQERDRSEELLLNILPEEVAEELKRNGSAEAKHFDQVTVLFTDFQGFTTMSTQVGPAELLAELNACFKAFDEIIARRGIEKIKTIGDAYMCASGLPDPENATPADVVAAALEMQAFMAERHAQRSAQGLFAFRMRAGIHTGPVVAGIVGVKKFQYDIWGDTVNTAARMESSGEVGRVNISGDTYALVKDAVVRSQLPVRSTTTDNQKPSTDLPFTFTPRGLVEAKGKGGMEMWFVDRA